MMFQLRPKIATTIATIVSMLSMPISGSAAWNQSCCPPQDCCQQEEVCCERGCSPLWKFVGAAAVGAAAGAITAASLDNGKGHKGRRGPQGTVGANGATGTSGGAGVTGPTGSFGPQGGSGFAVSDETLDFNFSLRTLNFGGESLTIPTFVQKPDGTIILGPVFSPQLGFPPPEQTGVITISPTQNGPVQIGTYHWGYVFNAPSGAFGVEINLNDLVSETPSGENIFPDNNGDIILGILPAGDTQYIHEFSFDVD